MIKNVLTVCMVLFYFVGYTQQNSNQAVYIPCSNFQITKPLSEIFKDYPKDTMIVKGITESQDKKFRIPQRFPKTVFDGPQYGNNPESIQKDMGTIPNKAPIQSIGGQNATGFRPMDPSGAAGPNHYVQMINSTTFRIYNKSTMAVALTGTLGNLWSPATGNNGDPIVLYDKAADRWMLAQFGSSADNKIYIAISTTPDPTGTYYTYTYVSPAFPDYLKFSVWHDGYYMTSNQAQKVFAFERSAMLAGVSTARSLYVSYSPPEGSGFFCPLAADASDGTLPSSGPCPIMSYSDNGWGGTNIDAVQIYQMSVNWVPATPTGSITLASAVPTTSFDASYDPSWNDVIQPITTQKLDGIGGVLMYRAQWKSWAGYNSVVLNWGVKINATQRGIMWCELRQDQSTNVWSMYQQGIYAPDAATRWMGSIAMDNNGSIGLAYMKTDASTTLYPGLYYAGRRSCDPLGTLPIAEEVAIAGTGYQTGTNRNGDYAHTSLDPDGITFWHTSEYFGGTSGSSVARTHIFSYQLPSCSNIANVNIALTGGSNPACSGQSLTFTATPFNGGTTPVYQWKVNGVNAGTNSPTFTTNSLSTGAQVTCVMTSNLPGVTNNPATSNILTITVNPSTAPTISISASATTICAGANVVFTAVITNGGVSPNFQWKVNGVNVGTNSSTFTSNTLQNGNVVTCTLTSNSTCATTNTAISNSVTMLVTSNASSSLSISASSTNICLGQTVTFTATATNPGLTPVYQWKVNGANVGTNSTTFTSNTLANADVVTCVMTSYNVCPVVATLGTSTTQNATNTSQGVAYPTYYGNGRQQYIILASELSSLGFAAGKINSLGFNVGNTVGNPSTLNGYTIKMANISATAATTTFQNPTFTTVFGPINYTPVLTSLNTHNFNTPFLWNGTSNVLVDICFSNQVTGTVAYVTTYSNAAFNATTYYQVDGVGGAAACTQATTTSAVTVRRPNMTMSNTLAVNTNSNGITMNVASSGIPSVTISTASTTVCLGASVLFTATPLNGGSNPIYQWKINGNNVGSNSATFTTTALSNNDQVSCVMTSNSTCVSSNTATSNTVTMAVNNTVTPTIVITASGNNICSGANVTFTASITNGGTTPFYQWKINGNNVGSNSNTFSSNSLNNGDQVTCTLTSNANCIGINNVQSNGIIMVVSGGVPSLTISTNNNPSCQGQPITFTATASNVGNNPVYQWKVNGVNAGTNSNTFSSSSLTNGQVVTCQLTSTNVCPATVTLGTGTSVNATTSNNGTVYPTRSGNGRQQYILRASDLTALGMTAGNINSLGFTIGSSVGNPVTLNGYTIKMGHTTATAATTTFLTPTWTTVFGPVNYTPTISTVNTHTLASPFVWNGSSNIVVDICFSNQVTGSVAYQTTYSTAPYNSTTYYAANGTTGANACNQATTTTAVSTRRPNMTINYSPNQTATSNGITLTINPLPTVNAGTYANVCLNSGSVSLSGTPVGGSFSGANVSGNIFTPNTLGSNPITYTYTDGNNCSNSNTTNISVIVCSGSLQVKAFVEGYYIGNGLMTNVLFQQGVDANPNSNVTDSIEVSLHNANPPFNVVHSYKGVLMTNGDILCSFPSSVVGNSYYIVLNQRNTIQTWSANAITFTGNDVYDFTDVSSKAFGNNMILVSTSPDRWALYSGDVNQDLAIDALDYLQMDADITNGVGGYYATDLNGDGSVDVLDYLIAATNIVNGITAFTP